MSRKKVIIISSSVVLVAAAILIFNMRNKEDGKIEVQISKVERHKIVQTVTATGHIQPKTQVKISADVGAKIIELKVKEGDWVEKGELLVKLDQERIRATVESAEANLRSVEANSRLAKENMLKAGKDYDRIKELFDRKLESQASLDQANAAYQVEKARYQSVLEQVDQAAASLKQARDDLSKTTIFAPMSGTISQLNKEVGEIALGSQFQEDVIMVVSNLAGMEALVDVDENDIVSVAVGDSARIEVDALPNVVLKGTVTDIANTAKISGSGSADQKTEFEVKIAVNDPGKELRPGMTASSDIITETRENTLGVPIQSVAVRTPQQLKKVMPVPKGDVAIADDSAGQNFVPDKDGFVQVVFVVKDGIASAVQVKTGIQSETHIEITDGISEGDEIVVGNYRAISQSLRNGSPVVVATALAGN